MKVVIALTAALLATASAAAIRTPATLRLTAQPLAVKGSHFAPKERLRVTVVVGAKRGARTLTTTRTGTFSLSLGFVAPWDPCTGPLTVTASGPQDRAVLKRAQRECAPPG